jgi:hypothetical protein
MPVPRARPRPPHAQLAGPERLVFLVDCLRTLHRHEQLRSQADLAAAAPVAAVAAGDGDAADGDAADGDAAAGDAADGDAADGDAATAPAAAAAPPPGGLSRARAAAAVSHLLLDVLQALAHAARAGAGCGAPAAAGEASGQQRPPPPPPQQQQQQQQQQPLLPPAQMLAAGDLLLAYAATPEGAKHAAKLAAALGLQRPHVRDWGVLAERTQALLGGRGTAGAAVRLMMQMEVRPGGGGIRGGGVGVSG